jgi:hypothetical protein
VKRCDFITVLGAAAASHAQQPKMPVIGYLSARSSKSEMTGLEPA